MYTGKSRSRLLPAMRVLICCTVMLTAAVITLIYHAPGISYGQSTDQTADPENTRKDVISFENDRARAGVPLKVLGAPQGSTYHWEISGTDGTMKSFETAVNYYTPEENDEEKLITVTVEGMEDATAAIYYSTLPVIYISSNAIDYYDVDEEYSAAAARLQGNEEYSRKMLYDGNIYIRLRGNSTKYRDKRPFNIKLEEKADLLGMGESKHWTLLANFIDHTLMRNKLLYDFSGTIGMDTYMKSENVVLIFNHQYYGVYQLCEQIRVDNERVDIYDWEKSAQDAADAIVNRLINDRRLAAEDAGEVKNNLKYAMCFDMGWISDPHTFSYDADKDGASETYKITDYVDLPEATGGTLMEMDFYAFDSHNPSTMITAYSQPIYFKAPEYAATDPELYGYTQSYIQVFEYALHSADFFYHENNLKFESMNRSGGNAMPGYAVSSFAAPEYDGKHYSELFDMDSLVQNFLVCEFSMNWDGMKNSVFLYKDIDGLFHMGPVWDFDWAWGNINMYNINTWYPTSWQTTENDFTYEQYYQTVQWNRSLIRDPYFLLRVYEKYKEIRNTAIEDIIKDGGTIDTYETELKKAAGANDARWGYAYEQNLSPGFEGSIENMKTFLDIRTAWLDKQFASFDTLIASLGYYQPSNKLEIAKMDSGTNEKFTEITAEVTDPDIAYVAFQVNGSRSYTEKVTEGRAVCKIPDKDLASGEEHQNIVEILAKDAGNEYIIDTMEEGNYYNAISNYAVFEYDPSSLDIGSSGEVQQIDDISEGDHSEQGTTDSNISSDTPETGLSGSDSSITGSSDDEVTTGNKAAHEVMAEIKDKTNNTIIMAAAIIAGLFLAGALLLLRVKTRKKRDDETHKK